MSVRQAQRSPRRLPGEPAPRLVGSDAPRSFAAPSASLAARRVASLVKSFPTAKSESPANRGKDGGGGNRTRATFPTPKAEPALGERCAVCPKKLPAIALREGDPFCSNDCARKYHDVPLSKALAKNYDKDAA